MARIKVAMDWGEVGQELEENPISRDEARDLIERNAGTIGIPCYLSLMLISAVVIASVSLFSSSYPKSISDYVVLLMLISFVLVTLLVVITIHSKPVSFDRHGLSIGWFWADKKQYDWDQVIELRKLPFLPSVAVLNLSDRKCWPIFMDLDRTKHLHDAIMIWKSAR